MSGTNKQTDYRRHAGTTYVESSNDDTEEKGGNILPSLASKIQKRTRVVYPLIIESLNQNEPTSRL